MKLAIAAPFAFLLLTTPLVAQSQARTGQRQDADSARVQEFQNRLQAYLNLRQQLTARLDPLATTANGAELAARQAALAAAMRAARVAAKPGDLLPPATAAQIRTVVLDDFRRRSAVGERATFSEVANVSRPAINRAYPAAAALPTVPPLLLLRLPRLPDNLQYRFYGRHLVLLDGDLQVIVDYIENVLPPH